MSQFDEEEQRTYKHWATVISEEAINRFGLEQTIATGWSPSGFYHLGNFREGVTCRAINKELKNLGAKTRFILNIDNLDPFDKIPQFFQEYKKELQPYLGRPINETPDPLGCHKSYADHFISNAIEIMETFDVNPEPIQTSTCYKEGRYDKYARLFLENSEKLYELTEKITGSRMVDFFLIQCPECGHIAAPKVINTDIDKIGITVEIICSQKKGGCGFRSKIKLGETKWKLKWRLDWAARQDFFGVTIESSGKDHGVAGGSIDTSLAIHKEIFNKKNLPMLLQHGFITVGGKKLSGSAGSGIPVSEFPKILQPETFLYKIYRNNLRTDFDFKVKIDVPTVATEFDNAEELYYQTKSIEHKKTKEKTIKAYELALINRAPEKKPLRVDYGLLATIEQVCLFDETRTIEKLKEQNILPEKMSKKDYASFQERFSRVKYWLENYADERIKFSIVKKPVCAEIKKIDVKIISLLEAAVKALPDNLSGDEITQHLYNFAKENEIKPSKFFNALYLILLDKKSGPRAGTLVDVVGYTEVLRLIHLSKKCFE
ncbi:MAG: lysine--tRNA ligase [Candidatus Heimdallarchaeaceae archaeon]